MRLTFKGPGDLANDQLDYLYEVERKENALLKEMYSVKDEALAKLQLIGVHPKFLEDIAVCIAFSFEGGCEEADRIAASYNLSHRDCFAILEWTKEFEKVSLEEYGNIDY